MVGRYRQMDFERVLFPTGELVRSIVGSLLKGMPWSVELVQLQKFYGVPQEWGLIDVGCLLHYYQLGRVYLLSHLSESVSPVRALEIDLVQLQLDERSLLYVSPFHGFWVPDGETHREYLGKKLVGGFQFDLVLVSVKSTEDKRNDENYLNNVQWHFPPQVELRP